MKNFLAVVGLILATALPLLAQSKAAGIYDSTKYYAWGASIAAGNSATGAQTITVCPAFMALPDGRIFQPFAGANAVFSPITVDSGGPSVETVTPTAVSYVTAPAAYSNANGTCANVTATFNNTHGASLNPLQIVSGDQGYQEAVNDASLNGGGLVYWQFDGGTVTLSTSGATTTLCASCLPARSLILGVVARVNTTITGCSGGWELGDGTTAARFTAANGTLTSGTLSAVSQPFQTSAIASTTTGFVTAGAAQSLVNTCVTSNASAGAVHARTFGLTVVVPAN